MGGRSQISFGDDSTTAAAQNKSSKPNASAAPSAPAGSLKSNHRGCAKDFADQQRKSSVFSSNTDENPKSNASSAALKGAKSKLAAAAAFASTTASRKGTSSNAYASGANQNSGNVITDRPSTRVHAPPGGRSQISFGGYDTAASNARTKRVKSKLAAAAAFASTPKAAPAGRRSPGRTAKQFAQQQLTSSVFASANSKSKSPNRKSSNQKSPNRQVNRSSIFFG